MNKVLTALDFLAGKKTYIVSALIAADGIAHLIVNHNWLAILPYILTGAFGGALRAAIAKVEAKVDAAVPAIAPIVDSTVTTVEDIPAPAVK